VTHSSAAGLEALMRGIPVYCARECGYAPLCRVWADFEPNPPPVDIERVESFLARFAYALWSSDEIRNGDAFSFLRRNHYV
jgi:hypothetical protein